MINIKKIHLFFGGLTLPIILSFWIGTVLSELLWFENVYMVKKLILFVGIPLLVLSMAITGASGNFMAKKMKSATHDELPFIKEKRKRMLILAFNGIFIMIPLAYLLYQKAYTKNFDTSFYLLQFVELLIGIFQITLIMKQITTIKRYRKVLSS